jgi:hypothetical protein
MGSTKRPVSSCDSARELLVFCAQCRDGKNDMHGEGQKIQSIISDLPVHPDHKFHCNYQPMPTPKVLQELLLKGTCAVFGIHIIGHDDSEGLYLVSSKNSKKSAHVEASILKELIQSTPSIEVVILNSCDTVCLGRDLKTAGVKHVVCWKGKLADAVAAEFSTLFYQTLNRNPSDYRKAFIQGEIAVRRLQHEKGHVGDQKPFGEPCYLCNSAAGDILPAEGTEPTHKGGGSEDEKEDDSFPPKHQPAKEQEQEDNSEDDGVNRSMKNPKGENELHALK